MHQRRSARCAVIVTLMLTGVARADDKAEPSVADADTKLARILDAWRKNRPNIRAWT